MTDDSEREQSISNVIHKSQGPLKKLIQTAQDLTAINQQLQNLLDPAIAAYCSVGEWRNNCLTLLVDNAACATRLRFMQLDLLSKLRSQPQFAGVGSLKIKLKMPTQTATKATAQTKPPRTISATAAATILAAAESIEDAALKAALERLAARHKD